MKSLFSKITIAVLTLLFFVGPTLVLAATYNFNGAQDGNWYNVNNWNLNIIPTSNDEVFIYAPVTSSTGGVGAAHDITVNSGYIAGITLNVGSNATFESGTYLGGGGTVINTVSADFNSDSYNEGRINNSNGNVTFNDISYNAGNVYSFYGEAIFQGHAYNEGVTRGADFFDYAYNGVDGDTTGEAATFHGNLTENDGSTGIKTRYYTSAITPMRDFTADGPWTIVADGDESVVVDLTNSEIDCSTTLTTVGGASFVGADQSSCEIEGCTDDTALNYDPSATVDDGSCEYSQGCTDEEAANYDPDAVEDDGSCYYNPGCTDPNANNYDDTVDFDDGSCTYDIPVLLSAVINEDQLVLQYDNPIHDLSYESGHVSIDTNGEVTHCADTSFDIDPEAFTVTLAMDCQVVQGEIVSASYDGTWIVNGNDISVDPFADVDVDNITVSAEGCTDPLADNYDSEAIVDDGSCTFSVTDLYFTGFASSDWSNIDNWKTEADGSGNHPSQAPWLSGGYEDAYGAINLHLGNGANPPVIDVDIDGPVTAGSDIPGVTNNATIYSGEWSGASFVNSAEGAIEGGTFDNMGFINQGTINGGIWSGSNFSSEGGVVTGGTGWPQTVYGCSDLVADNYDAMVTDDDGSCTYNAITTCGTLDKEGQTYTLAADVSSEGTCFTVAADNITIDGASHTIAGSVAVDGSNSDTDGTGRTFIVQNATTTGHIASHGSETGASQGGNITLNNVHSTNGDVAANFYGTGQPGGGGTVTLIDSSVAGTIQALGFTGAIGTGGTIVVNNSVVDLSSGRNMDVVGYAGTAGSIIFSNDSQLTNASSTVTANNHEYSQGGTGQVGGHYIYVAGVVSYNLDYLVPGNISSCGSLYFPGTYTLTTNLSSNSTCFMVFDEGISIDGNSLYSVTNTLGGNAIRSTLDRETVPAFTLQDITVTGDLNADGDNSQDPGKDAGSITINGSNITGNVSAGGGLGATTGGDISVTDSVLNLSSSKAINVEGGDGGTIGSITLDNVTLEDGTAPEGLGGSITIGEINFSHSGAGMAWVYEPIHYWSYIDGLISTATVPYIDSQAPELQSATIDGNVLTLTYDDSDLNVDWGTATVEVYKDDVLLSGANHDAVVDGSTVTVTLPDGAALQGQDGFTLHVNTFVHDTAGNYDIEQTGFLVTNITESNDTEPPVLQSASVNGSTLTLTYDDTDLVPDWAAEGAYLAINYNGSEFSGITQEGSDVVGNTFVAHLISPVVFGQGPITLSHGNFMRDTAGNFVEATTTFPVTNDTPAPAPVLQSASINGDVLTLTYNTTDLVLDWGGADPFFVAYLDGSPFSGAAQDENSFIDGNTFHVGLNSSALHGQGPFTLRIYNIVRNSSGIFAGESNGLLVTNETLGSGGPRTLYFTNSANDEDWGNINNWWNDEAGTEDQADSLPTSIDNVVISAHVTENSGDAASVNTASFVNGAYLVIDLAVANGATFDSGSSNASTITGDATFINFGYNDGSGHVTGTSTFEGHSVNYGGLPGNAVFSDLSHNQGGVSGDATFNDESYNAGVVSGNVIFTADTYDKNPAGTIGGSVSFTSPTGVTFNIGGSDSWVDDANGWTFASTTSWIFTNSSHNDGVLNGHATFYDTSHNNGGIDADAEFADASYNNDTIYAIISGDATFDGDYSENGGTVNGTKIRYYNGATTTLRDFTDPGDWTVIADGVNVDVTDAVYNGNTTFEERNGGHFVGIVDTTSPSVSLTAPLTGTISGSALALTASASDNLSIAGVKFYISSPLTLIGTEDTTFPYSGTLDTTSFVDGAYTLYAVARDSSGNVATSTGVPVTISNPGGQGHLNNNVNSGGGSSGGGSTSSYVPPPVYAATSTETSTGTTTLGTNPLCPVGLICTPISQPSFCPPGLICTPITNTPNTNPATPHYQFLYDLSLGARSLDVKLLQIFLNTHNFLVSLTGAGSKGHETTIFGPATKNAVIKFQKAYSITPAIGFFGPITRGVVNSSI